MAAARTASGLTLLIAPSDKDVDQLTSDARFLYGALEGASEAAVERAVLPLPSLQVDPYRGMSPHFRVAAARARALHAAATGTARLVIASAAALLPRVSPAKRLLEASIAIRAGTEIEPEALADLLADAGFTREDPVEEHGSFAIRGGIVDIFPAAAAEPVRLEFVGDMVESLRRFDPSTQRSTGATDHLVVVPVRERFDDDERTCSRARRPCEPRAASDVIVSEYEQVQEQARKVRDTAGIELRRSIEAADMCPLGHRTSLWWSGTISKNACTARRVSKSSPLTTELDRCPASPRWSSEAVCRTGSQRSMQPARRGDTVLFIAETARSRRADGRDSAGIRSRRRSG